MPSQGECRCGPSWRAPKVNGACGACGGWLPGERPKPLPWTSLEDDLKAINEAAALIPPDVDVLAEMYRKER